MVLMSSGVLCRSIARLIEHVGISGHEMANAMVGHRLQGGQGQVGAPQLHLPGLVDEIEIPIWAGRIYRI